jgi:trehalose 6-phosphate phosphatase
MDRRMTENSPAKSAGDMLPAPAGIVPDMDQTALLLDIDGTLLELAPTPAMLWCRPNWA